MLTVEQKLARALSLGVEVDTDDAWLLSALTWRLSTKGYIEAAMYAPNWRGTVKFHHFLVGRPLFDTVDHIDRNKLNNRRSNLRYATDVEQSRNRAFVDDASNVRITRYGKYEVRISINSRVLQVGTYATMNEAKEARDAAYRREGSL